MISGVREESRHGKVGGVVRKSVWFEADMNSSLLIHPLSLKLFALRGKSIRSEKRRTESITGPIFQS
jgi:hypothetical protein